MKTIFTRVLLVAVILLQLIWFVAPRHGSPPPNSQALAAARQMSEQPSSATRAAFEAQMSHDADMAGRQNLVIFALLLALDGIGLYFFWRPGGHRHAA